MDRDADDGRERSPGGATTRLEAELLRGVLQAATEYSIVATDPEGTITLFNRGAERVLGYAAREVVGVHTPALFHDPAEVAARAAELGIEPGFGVFVHSARQGEPETRDWTYVARDGSRRLVSLTVTPIRGEGGEVDGFIGIARDVTEQRVTERALHESEARFRTALEHSPIGMAMLDPEGRWLLVNRALCDIVGYGPEELRRLTFQDITHPDDLEADLALVRQLLAGEIASYQMEKRYVHKDGSLIWIELTASLVRDEAERPLYFVSQIQDISRRKRIEESLRASREQLRALIDSSPLATVTLDAEGRVNLWNAAAEALFGWSREEVVGRPLPYVPAEERAHHGRLLERVLAGETLRGVEVERTTKHGTNIWIALFTTLLHDAEGEVTGVLSIVKDISERKRAEEELRAQEERYRALVEAASDIIFTSDPRGRFTYVNPTAEGVLGYPREALQGMSYADLVRADRREEVRAFYAGQMAARTPSTYLEFPVLTRDGREVWIGQSARLLLRGGAVTGLQAVARDISARREVDRLKDEFVGVVSHELRSPLTSIIGSLKLLSGAPIPEEKRRPMLRIALENSERLLRLVNDFLDLERLNAGQVALRIEGHDLPPLLEKAVQAVEGMAAAQDVSIRVDAAAERARVDPDRMVQVLVNLLSNAIKFSPAGAEVRLAARPTPEGTEIAVADAGRGIPADKLGEVFERFRQVDRADATQGRGSGLGLAICRSLVEAHGGSISVESELGRGSTFRVRIPGPAD